MLTSSLTTEFGIFYVYRSWMYYELYNGTFDNGHLKQWFELLFFVIKN
mgnify:CR=1 FL=1